MNKRAFRKDKVRLRPLLIAGVLVLVVLAGCQPIIAPVDVTPNPNAAEPTATGQTANMPDTLDWPYYGNDPGGMRYVDVDQINPANVAQVQPAWIFHTNVANDHTSFETQPMIVDGVVYLSSPHNHVFAVDAATGELQWTYNPTMPPLAELAICCGQTNRGVAVGDGKVFMGQLDATLVALDAATGEERWKVAVADWREKWTETMAPLYIDGKVIIGASGGEFLRRGFVDAYAADTGEQLWRFYTAPGPGEFGNETWEGDSWQTGGVTIWTTPVADLDLGLLYITTGNAAPDENGSERGGDNLFAVSVVALDLETGAYVWHFQEVHHDLWDYDAAQPAHLFTLEKDGEQTPALGHANKNGNYFILERRTGEPLYEVTEVSVPTEPAWQKPSPTQPMPATDPLLPQEVESAPERVQTAPMWTPPQEQPLLIQPGFEAGPEWTASAYSPRTRYAYIQAGGYEPWLYHAMPPLVNSLGSTAVDAIPGVENYGLFDAVDTTTGKIAWQIRAPEKIVSGVVVAGDLVFYGESNGKFNAVDAVSGDILWSYTPDRPGVGGANGSPAAYVVNGREYVIMTFGGNNQVRSNSQSSPPGDAVIAFALPRDGAAAEPMVVTADPRQVETGAVPASAITPPVSNAPADATVIELETHDFNFHPNEFTVPPGTKVAVHLVNTGVPPAGFAIKLPAGPTALQGPVMPNEDAFFVFTAPEQPGDYEFFSPLGPQRFFGMTGTMSVATDATVTVTATTALTSTDVPTTTGDVIEQLRATPNTSRFVELLDSVGLLDALQAEGETFTIFAPTNEAFAALPAATLADLQDDPAALVNVLQRHLVAGDVSADRLVALGTALTLSGASLPVTTTDGELTIDGAAVVEADIPATNGVIHMIDAVLLPPSE